MVLRDVVEYDYCVSVASSSEGCAHRRLLTSCSSRSFARRAKTSGSSTFKLTKMDGFGLGMPRSIRCSSAFDPEQKIIKACVDALTLMEDDSTDATPGDTRTLESAEWSGNSVSDATSPSPTAPAETGKETDGDSAAFWQLIQGGSHYQQPLDEIYQLVFLKFIHVHMNSVTRQIRGTAILR